MNGVIVIVIKKTVNKPTEVGNIKREISRQITATTPPNMNISQGFLMASLIDIIFSKTKVPLNKN